MQCFFDQLISDMRPIEVASIDVIDSEPNDLAQDCDRAVMIFWWPENMWTSKLHGAVAHASQDQIIGKLECAAGQGSGSHRFQIRNYELKSRITTHPPRLLPRLLPLWLATHRLRTATVSAPFPRAKMRPGKSAGRHHAPSATPVAIASARQRSPFPPSPLWQSSSDNSGSASYPPRRTAASASPHRATDRPAPHRPGH